MDAAFELFYCMCAVRQARLIKQHGIDISNVDQTSLQTVLTVVLLPDRPIFVLKKNNLCLKCWQAHGQLQIVSYSRYAQSITPT